MNNKLELAIGLLLGIALSCWSVLMWVHFNDSYALLVIPVLVFIPMAIIYFLY